jgi:hypothetical protein
LRRQTDRGHREYLCFIAAVSPAIDDRRRTDPAVFSNPNLGANHGVRTDDGALADPRCGVDVSRRVYRGLTRLDGDQQLGLGHDLVVHVRSRLHARQTRSGPPHRDLEPKTVARDYAAPEFGAVDAAERGTGREWRTGAIENEDRRHLRERLDHQHGGHQRGTGKMPLKEIFTDRHILHRHEPVARLVLGDNVDEI